MTHAGWSVLAGALILSACVASDGADGVPEGDPEVLAAGIEDLPEPALVLEQPEDGAEQPEGLGAVLTALGVEGQGPMGQEAQETPATEPGGKPEESAPAPADEAQPEPEPEPEPEPAPPPQDLPPPATLEEAINRLRASEGLGPLYRDSRLDRAAARHLRDMTITGFFGHTGSDGSTLPARVSMVGFCFRRLEENLFRGDSRISRVMHRWENSPQDRRNLIMEEADLYGLAEANDVWVLIVAEGC